MTTASSRYRRLLRRRCRQKHCRPLRRRAAAGKSVIQRLRMRAHPAFTLMLGRESCRYSASPFQPRGDSLGLNPFQHAVFVIAYMNGSIAQKNRPILAIFFGFRRLAKENARRYSSIWIILRNISGKTAHIATLIRTKSLKNAKNCQTQRKIVRKCEFNANAHQKSLRTAPPAAALQSSCASAHRERRTPWHHCTAACSRPMWRYCESPVGQRHRVAPLGAQPAGPPYCTPPCVPPCSPPASSRTCALERSSRSAAITIARASSSGFARSFLLGRFAKIRVSSFISALI